MFNSDLFKSILLGLLDYFVKVCEENGLKYYLAFGSVLGAVRHKGMIPWDDDIDIHMPRDDYEKLRKLPNYVWGKEYRLASWENTRHYRYDFVKLEALNTTLIERIHPDYVGGVFIDIFPLDKYPSDPNYIERIEKNLTKVYTRILTCTIKHDNECGSLYELFILKLKRLFYRHRRTVYRLERIAQASGGRGDMIADFHNYFYRNGGRGGCPSDFLGEGAKLEFEGKLYIVPRKWDAYLTHLYGDYMTPPPVEKQYGHHFDYINCERRLSGSELKEEFRRIHRKYAFRYSLKTTLKRVFYRP